MLRLEKIRKIKAAAQQNDAARREATQAPGQNADRALARRPRGRPAEPGSRRDVARRTRISPREQLRIERHVALVAKYPLFENARWTRAEVLKAGCLLEALPADRRREVVPRLAELDPPGALRLLQTLVSAQSGVLPIPPATAGTSSPAAHELSTPGRHAPPTSTAADAPRARGRQLLLDAKVLVLHGARRLQDATLHSALRRLAAELDAILVHLPRGEPAAAARVLGDAPNEPIPQLLLKATALVLTAGGRFLDPMVQARLARVALGLNDILLQLPSHASGDRRLRS